MRKDNAIAMMTVLVSEGLAEIQENGAQGTGPWIVKHPFILELRSGKEKTIQEGLLAISQKGGQDLIRSQTNEGERTYIVEAIEGCEWNYPEGYKPPEQQSNSQRQSLQAESAESLNSRDNVNAKNEAATVVSQESGSNVQDSN